MVFDWATQSPYTGGNVIFIETYRGYDIYFLDHWGLLFYCFVDPDGVERNTFHSLLTYIKTYIDNEIGVVEPEPYWEYHSTYRDIAIYVWLPDGTPFTAYIIDQWYMAASLSTLQAKIDEILGPPPEPDHWEYHSTYRGIYIYVWMPTASQYQAQWNSIWHVRTLIETLHAEIDAYLEPEPEADTFIETYRGLDIYRRPDEGMFYAIATELVTIIGLTLTAIRANIDEYLDFLEDPPLDPGSILEQLTTYVMDWVNFSLETWLAPVYGVVDDLFASASVVWDGLFAGVSTVIADVSGALTALGTELRGRWDVFTTLTLPDIWAMITANAAAALAAIDLKGTELEASMDAKLVDFTAWVRDFVKLSDPYSFLVDPMGFITTAFNTLIAPFSEGVVRSFWEGFEEGQETG